MNYYWVIKRCVTGNLFISAMEFGDSSASDDDSLVELERLVSDDDEESRAGSDEDDDFIFHQQQQQMALLVAAVFHNEMEELENEVAIGPLEHEYRNLLVKLRRNDHNSQTISISSRELLVRVLQTIDEFCEALESIDGLESLELGSVDHSNEIYEIENCFVWPKLELADETTSQAWDKLCQAIHTVSSKAGLGKLDLGGYLLSAECMVHVLRALQHIGKEIPDGCVLLPWNTVSGEDYRSFVEAFSHFHLALEICGDIPYDISREEYLAAVVEPANHFQDGGIICQLACLEGVTFGLVRVDLNLQECKSLGKIIESSSCSMVEFRLIGCTFPTNGHCIAGALKRNETIKTLHLENCIQDDTFRDALLASISVNTFINSLPWKTILVLKSLLTFFDMSLLPARRLQSSTMLFSLPLYLNLLQMGGRNCLVYSSRIIL